LSELYSRPLNGLDFFGTGGVVTNCIVSGFRGIGTTTNTVGRGVHCFNPLSTGAPAVNLAIVNNTFTDNQIAIHLRGDPGANPGLLRATANVRGNMIAGFGPAPDWNVGIWVVCGVAAEVIGNNISDFSGTGDMQSSGIAAYDAAASTHGRFVSLLPMKYEGNKFSNNGQHLLLVGGNESQIVNNKFVGSVQSSLTWGAVGFSGTNIVVANNNFADLPTGILLVGNESWGPPWPTMPQVANPSLTANWFCNVPERIRIAPAVVGVQEQGTAECPFRPIFQTINGRGVAAAAGPDSSVSLTLRSWHGQPVVIQTSTDLQNWLPVYTNSMTLPTFDYQDVSGTGSPRRFYRAVAP